MRPSLRSIVLVAAAIFSCTFAIAQPSESPVREVQVGAAQFERAVPPPAWVEPLTSLPTTADKSSPVVNLLADTQMDVGSQAAYVHRAWQMNTTAALTQAGQPQLVFNPAYQRTQLHLLRVHRGGTVIDKLPGARITFMQREQGLENGVYSGVVAASILVDDLRVGDTMEIAYTNIGDNPVFHGRYSDNASWDQSSPTEWRRVTLRSPADRKVAWRLMGDRPGDAVTPEETVAGGIRRLRWQARGLPRSEHVEDAPSDYLQHRFLQFSEWASWREVTDWAAQLFTPPPGGADGLREVVATLSRHPTEQERVAAALLWVQNEIRYVSLSLGESSHRPASPATTLARRYGDCKDKSVLLVELLRAMGIAAQPVLVTSDVPKGHGRFLPSPVVFDHVIVRAQVGGRDHYLDATRLGQAGRLDRMGQFWEDTEVLVVAPGNDAFTIVKTPDFAAISRNELSEKISLPKHDGPGVIEVRHVFSGSGAEVRRQVLGQMAPDALQKTLLEPYEERYPGARHRKPAVLQDDLSENLLTLVMELEVPKLALESGQAWGVRFRPTNLYGVLRSAPTASRTVPLSLGQPRKLRYSLEVEFPPEVSKLMDPFQRVMRDPAFAYDFNMTFRGNRGTVTAELQVLSDRVEPARTGAYLANLRRTSEHPFAFVVQRSDVKGSTLFGGTTSLQKMIEERLKGRIAAVTRGIDAGRLTGEDLAEALCDRAEAHSDLGRPEDGLKDAQSAVKEAPNHARAYECRGNLYFALGEMPRAVADYTRAISLDPAQPAAFYRRGHARYYSGQYQQAAEDFAKGASGEGADEGGRLYAQLWRLWAQKRLGVEPDAAQVALAAERPDGEWPRPALALFHGRTTVEAMLRSIGRKKDDEREMALVEGYFYAGQWHLLRGEQEAAAEYFRKARAKGITVYIEHVGAGLELARMGRK
jgi:transglutaminase-like putative cysteine protease